MSADHELEARGYRSIRVLGRNVQGGRITYLGERTGDGARVVIKHFSFSRADADWAGYKAHERELETLRQLDHPSIPKFVDAFPMDDGFALVQEYVEAPALSARRRWDFAEVEDIARQLLELLVYIQNQNPPILHRDLKPENVLRDGMGEVSLIDFGLAKTVSQEGAASTIAAGTPGFMAPEQFFNTELTTATDLYGLGATLIALLSGVSSDEISGLVNTAFQFDLGHLDGVPPYFVEWLEVLTRPERDDRYPDAAAARKALKTLRRASEKKRRQAMVPAPVPATPAPQPRDVRAAKGKRGAGIGVMLNLMLVLVIGSAGVYMGLRDHRQSFSVQNEVKTIQRIASGNLRKPLHPGGSFYCSGRERELVGGTEGVPKRLGRVTARKGCVLTLRDIEVKNLYLSDSSRVTAANTTFRRIDARGGQLTLTDVKVGLLYTSSSRHALVLDARKLSVDERLYLGSRGTYTFEELTVKERLSINDGVQATVVRGTIDGGMSVGKGATLTVKGVSITGKRAAVYVRRGATLRGEGLSVSGRLSLSDNAVAALEKPRLHGGVSVSRGAIFLARAPVVRGRVRARRGYRRYLKPDEDMDRVLVEMTRARDEKASAKEEAERTRREARAHRDALIREGCDALAQCAQDDESISGQVRVSLRVRDGAASVSAAHPKRDCFKRAAAALKPHKTLGGTLRCELSVKREHGATIVRRVRSRFR